MDELFPVQSTGVGARRINQGLDFYETPRWAVDALLDRENVYGKVWEPCCGNGAIGKVLTARGADVFASDLEPQGYGARLDFLRDDPLVSADWIITNPPYFIAERMIGRALELARRSQGNVAMLLRLAFLEGQGRYEFFQEMPPARVLVFSTRVNFIPGKSSGMPVAWYVWKHGHRAPPELGWIP